MLTFRTFARIIGDHDGVEMLVNNAQSHTSCALARQDEALIEHTIDVTMMSNVWVRVIDVDHAVAYCSLKPTVAHCSFWLTTGTESGSPTHVEARHRSHRDDDDDSGVVWIVRSPL